MLMKKIRKLPEEGFGRWLCERMVALGLTNDFLAKQVAVDPITVTNWRQNRARPVGEKVGRMAVLLGLTESELRKRIADYHGDEPTTAEVA